MDDREIENWIIEKRREFHRIPELSFSEFKTQKKVMEILKEIGLVGKSIANTGVVATIYGNGPGNTIAIRADMDGLEVDEELTPFNANYISQHLGFMHSCGHDGHMAIVLGAARLIMQHSASFSGSVRLIFQPAEEQPPGGALNIINEGGLRGVDAILGLHVFGSVNAGEIKLKCGPFLATSNIFTLTVTGKGGHHLSPELNIDSISIGSQFIGCIKKEIEKKLSEDQFRIGVGKISGGAQFNRTPDNVEILGSFRTFHRHDAALIETILQQTLDTLMSMYAKQEYPGLPMYELNIVHGYPALVNDSAFSQRAINILKENFPLVDDKIEPLFGADDFAHYLQKIPGSFIILGTKNVEKGITEGNHSSRFDIDEGILINGARTLTTIVLDFLNNPGEYLP